MNLPKDIYQEIFSYLSEQDILSCSRVCKYWKNYIRKYRENILTYGYAPICKISNYRIFGEYTGYKNDYKIPTILGDAIIYVDGKFEIECDEQQLEKLNKKLENMKIILYEDLRMLSSIIEIRYNINLENLHLFMIKIGFTNILKSENKNIYRMCSDAYITDVKVICEKNHINIKMYGRNIEYNKYKKLIMDEIERIKQPKLKM